VHRKVLDTIQRHKLVSPGDHILVAVSGGPDSVALVAALSKLRKRLEIELAVAHLNHGLRGKEADEDERFVRELAKRRKLRFRCGRADIAARRRTRGGSLEEVARSARYAFLRKAAKALGANVLATGHTADDNAETLLMNLLRGSGLRGLAAIPIQRPEGELRLIRPLLEVTRAEVMEFLEKHGLDFRTDASNADTSLTRNRVRAELIPQLAEQYNPAVAGLLAGTADQLRDVAELVTGQVERAAERFVEPVEDGFALPLRAVLQMPRAIRTELLRRCIADQCGRVPGAEQVRTFERFLLDSARPRPSLGRGLSCDVVFDRVVIRRTPPQQRHQVLDVSVPGVTAHPTLNVELATRVSSRPDDWRPHDRPAMTLSEFWQRVEQGERLDLTQDFDFDRLDRGRLVLRARQPGDIMQPIGFGGVKKVQDIFVDEKLPAAVRGKVPLLCRGKQVLWVPGYRIADSCKITDTTERLLVVQLMILPAPSGLKDSAHDHS